MALFLVELTVEAAARDEVEDVIAAVARQATELDGELIESQVTADLSHVYVVVEGDGCARLVVRPEELPHVVSSAGPDPVRLVGADLDEIKGSRGGADYLVEWDIPAEVTLEQYLARKAEKAPLYAGVPEVSFLRTYVREDTEKCLCFYDAPDEAAVRHARDVVETPVSRLHALRPAGAEG